MRLVYFLEWHYGPGNYLIVFPFPYSVIVPCTMRAWCMTAALHLAAILNLNVQRRALARSLMAQGLDQLNTVPLQDLGIEDHPRAQ